MEGDTRRTPQSAHPLKKQNYGAKLTPAADFAELDFLAAFLAGIPTGGSNAPSYWTQAAGSLRRTGARLTEDWAHWGLGRMMCV